MKARAVVLRPAGNLSIGVLAVAHIAAIGKAQPRFDDTPTLHEFRERWGTPPVVGDQRVGVATGDVDGDLRPDVVGVGGGEVGVWRCFDASGPQCFQIYAANATGVALTDIDDDADLDLVLAATAGVELRLNDSHGQFDAPFPLGFGAGEVVAADMNSDGREDLLLYGDNQPLRLMRRIGPSAFAPPERIPPTSVAGSDFVWPTRLFIGAFNPLHAGLDLVYGHELYVNFGDGRFVSGGLVADDAIDVVCVGDFDADGDTDVLSELPSGGSSPRRLKVSKNMGGWFVTEQIIQCALERPFSGVSTDIDGDSDADVVVVGLNAGFGRRAFPLVNDGHGTFSLGDIWCVGGNWTSGIAVADLDASGLPDIVCANRGAKFEEADFSQVLVGRTLSVLRDLGAPVPSCPQSLLYDGASSHRFGSVAFNDVDADSDLDVIAGGRRQSAYARRTTGNRNLGDGRFSRLYVAAHDEVYTTEELASTDLYLNGRQRLISRQSGSLTRILAPVAELPNNLDNPELYDPELILGPGADVIPNLYGTFPFVADLDADHDTDAGIFYSSGNFLSWPAEVRTYARTQDATFALPVKSYIPGEAKDALLHDWSQDGLPDLIVAANGFGPFDESCLCVREWNIVLARGNGLQPFDVARSIPVDRPIVGIGVGDVNGDSLADLVALVTSPDAVRVYPAVLGGFGDPADYPLPRRPATSPVIADLDRDFDADLIFITGTLACSFCTDPRPLVMVNDGAGGFTTWVDGPYAGIGVSAVCVGDANADGALDLALAGGPAVGLQVCLNRSVTPPGACSGDFNGDDAVNSADLSVLLAMYGQSVSPGTWADLNADGVINSADLSVLLSRFGQVC